MTANPTTATSIEDLLAKVPPEFHPIVEEYGLAFLEMTKQQVVAWIVLIAKGKTDEAYEKILAALPNQDLLGEWHKLNAKWRQENVGEARRQRLISGAGGAVLAVLFDMACKLVGL